MEAVQEAVPVGVHINTYYDKGSIAYVHFNVSGLDTVQELPLKYVLMYPQDAAKLMINNLDCTA